MSEAGRQKLRKQIQITKPWLKARGAVTPEGNLRSSQNALKTGLYSSFEPIRVLARWELEEQEMERFRAIIKTVMDAYSKSDATPPLRWAQVFENMSREDFLREWRKL